MYWILKDKKIVETDLYTWGLWFENSKDRIIERTISDSDSFEVSTVFLGINHGLDEKKPLVFETMIFTSNEKIEHIDQQMRRYSSYDDAVKGHKEMVSYVYDEILKAN